VGTARPRPDAALAAEGIMNPRLRALIQICILLAVIGVLVFLFPPAFSFVEMAARELRYFWWLILLLALAIWFIWGVGRKPKQ
jgi:hypothetical protein